MFDKESIAGKVIIGIAAGAASFLGVSLVDNIRTDYEQSIRIEVNKESIEGLNHKVDEILLKITDTNLVARQTQSELKELKEKLNESSN